MGDLYSPKEDIYETQGVLGGLTWDRRLGIDSKN